MRPITHSDSGPVRKSALRRLGLAATGLGLLALVVSSVVWAGNPGKEKVALTAAGNAVARSEQIRRDDLGPGFLGGSAKPDLSSGMSCSGYRPKQSDLVVVGAAETKWTKPGWEIADETEVLRTAKMVRLDWERTVAAPQVTSCLRQSFAKSVGPTARIVSFRRIPFPHVAALTRVWRGVAKVPTSSGTFSAEFDLFALSAGTSENSLVVLFPEAEKAQQHVELVTFARRLAKRLR